MVVDVLTGRQRVTLGQLSAAGSKMIHDGLATLDRIDFGAGNSVDVTGLSCKLIAGARPEACPNASPALPPSLLPHAEAAIRRLMKIPEGTTIHWVGSDGGYRGICKCLPDAPYIAPFDKHRWADVLAKAGKPSQTPAPMPPKDEAQTDGPFGGNRIRWKGKDYPLEGKAYLIVSAVWKVERFHFDDLKKSVNEVAADMTIHTWVNIAKNALQPLNLDWKLSADSTTRFVRKKPK